MHFRVRMGQRLIWLSVLFLLMLSGLGGRLYAVQILKHAERSRDAVAQRTLELDVGGRRGEIYDRNGIPLTDPQVTWGVAAFPTLIPDQRREAVAEELSVLLGVPLDQVREDLEPQPGNPVWVMEGVTQIEADRISRQALPGVVVAPRAEPYGPGSLAHHLVGLANESGHRSGLQEAYDQELSGIAVPHLVAAVDGRSRLLTGAVQEMVPTVGKQPYSLYTTIDARIQRAVEGVLDSWRDPDGKRLDQAAVVVMDPRTGELLAVASRPDFNPTDGKGTQMNWAVSAFEPGSVFKPIYAAYALERGLVRLDDVFDATHDYRVGNYLVPEHGGVHYGKITFRAAIAKSSNVVFAQLGYERLGPAGLMGAARLFRFGQGTGILRNAGGVKDGKFNPDESPGSLPDLAKVTGGIVAQAGFGQGGIMVTPLQMARAYCAIANGGLLPPVRLVTAIKDPAGKVIDRPQAGLSERIFSVETAGLLQSALAGVTSPRGGGTGTKAWVEGYGSAGKTGSAQVTDKVTHAWFAGYTPLTDPRFVIVVLRPDGGTGRENLGGEYAAPVFKDIAKAILAIPEP